MVYCLLKKQCFSDYDSRLESSTREQPRPPAVYDRLARQRPITISVSGVNNPHDVITVAVSSAVPISSNGELTVTRQLEDVPEQVLAETPYSRQCLFSVILLWHKTF